MGEEGGCWGMGCRLEWVQQAAFKCIVLLSAGAEGTLASPVRKFSLPFLYLLSKLTEIGICTHLVHSWRL